MVTNRITARNAVWAVFGQGAGQVLSLLFFLVIARFVSQASFGLVAVSLATVEFLRRIFIDPVTFVVTAKPAVEDRDFDICLTLLVIASSTISLLLFLLAPVIATLVGTPQAGPAMRAVAILLLAYGLSGTHGAWLARNMQFRTLALRSTGSVVAGGVVGITLALNGFEWWSLVAQQITISVVSVATLWIATEWRPHFAISWRDAQEMFRKVRHISMSAVSTSVANDADIFFASAYFGPAAAGIYNAGKRIMLAANVILVQAISAVTVSAFANIEDEARRAREFLNGLMFTSAVTAPAFGGLAATAPDIVAIILGPKWDGVGPILAALALSGYALSLGVIGTAVLLVAQRTHLDSISSAIAATANVLTFILVIKYGAVALAITVSVTTLLVVPIRLRFALRELGCRWVDVARVLAPSIAATGLMLVVLLGIRPRLGGMDPFLRLPIMIGVGALAYCAVMGLVIARHRRNSAAMADLNLAARLQA